MGAGGGDGPGGHTQRELKTLFLRAPADDWPALTQGLKTEFRAKPMGAFMSTVGTPTPVVLYARAPGSGLERHKLMILVEHRTERLMDIAEQPDALIREGFPTYDHFRRYWRARTRRPYRALDVVQAFRLEPWGAMYPDRISYELGRLLLERLYGDYLPDEHVPPLGDL